MRVYNPNSVFSPVVALCTVALLVGGATKFWLRWPQNVDSIPPMQVATLVITVPFSETVRPSEVRFALAQEHYSPSDR